MDLLLRSVDARGVARLTLNRPDRHNAFGDALIAELTAALEALAADPAIRAIILASTGKSFSAGADLDWMRRMADYSEPENLADARALARLLHVLDRLAKPTLALVQGPAFGGGVGLIACCDIVLAASRARFALSEVRLGLIPATISPYVVAAIGPRWSRRLFQTAEAIDAETARAIGLVHEVVAEDALEARADAVLADLLRNAPEAVAEAKHLVFLAEGRPNDEALREETSRRIAARRATAEAREGIAAFLGRRDPAWLG